MNTARSPQFWLGQRLGDQQRYKLVRPLGGGGIGDVYLAMDTRLGRRVAVKLLKGALAKSKEVLSRFEREVILSAALESEHIVEVLDYGVAAGDHPFYVMEYLNGQPLSHLIGRSTRLSPELVIQIAIQICAGLKVAHEGVVLWRDGEENTEKIKVIHRDLKPANIFLVPTAIGALVKVLDFGIAKKLHTDEQANATNLTQAFLGTFRYASPEQLINARNLDERADLYSLGMILYEMLSGTDPFGVCSTQAKQQEVAWAMAHDAGQPIPLRQRPECAHVPPELEEIVMRCLKRRVSDRFSSAQELMQALHAVPLSARKEPPTSPPRSVAGMEPTVAKPLTPSLDPTVNRPLVPRGSNVPDATIAQVAVNASAPLEETVAPSCLENPANGTIAQVPLPPDATAPVSPLAVEPTVPNAALRSESVMPQPQNHYRDETIAQIPPSVPPKRDETIAQVPPILPKRDETIAQVPPPLLKRDETIAQMPPIVPARRDETIAQAPPRIFARRDETIAQVPPSQNSGYSGQHSGQYSGQPGQYSGQHSGQNNGQNSGQYSGQHSGRDETLAQVPGSGAARTDENQAQIPNWGNHIRPDEALAHVSRVAMSQIPRPTNLPRMPYIPGVDLSSYRINFNSLMRQRLPKSMLLLGAGFLMGMLIMAGVYLFMRSSQSPQRPQSSVPIPSVRGTGA